MCYGKLHLPIAGDGVRFLPFYHLLSFLFTAEKPQPRHCPPPQQRLPLIFMADAEFDSSVDPTTIPINGVVGDGTEDQDAHLIENKELKEKLKRLLEQLQKSEKDLAAKEGRVQELLAGKNQAEAATEEDKKALDAISSRAVGLETELFRLQHDYFAATSERDDLLGQLQTLEAALEEAERAKQERDSKIGILEQEAKESGEVFGRRIRELEEELEGKVLEVRKVVNDKAEMEERLKQLDEKWKEFKLKNLELEKAIVGWREEKLELEKKVVVLQRELEKDERSNVEESLLNFAWAAAAAAAVASVSTAAALFYLKYAKQGKGGD